MKKKIYKNSTDSQTLPLSLQINCQTTKFYAIYRYKNWIIINLKWSEFQVKLVKQYGSWVLLL